MEEALQIVKNNPDVKNEAKMLLEDFHKNNLKTQAKIGEKYTALVPGIKQVFELMSDDIYELAIENEELKKISASENIEKANNSVKVLYVKNNNKDSRNFLVRSRLNQRIKLVKELQ